MSPGSGLGFGSWKTGEGIGIVAGGAILTMILAAAITAVVAAGSLAAAEITAVVAGGTLARRRAMGRRVLRSSRLARR